MNGIRRLPVVLGLAAAVLTGGIVPASATFTDGAAVATSIETAQVAAPDSLSGKLTCLTELYTMNASWKASESARLSGYRVNIYYYYDGSVERFDVPATATSWSGSLSILKVSLHPVDFSVTAVTDYGWFKESSKQGPFHC